MSFEKDQKGFIFTLDGTLAVLVSILTLAGVSVAFGSSTIFEQQNPLRLERYANDALVLIERENMLKNIETYSSEKLDNLADNIAENIVPDWMEFELIVESIDEKVRSSDDVGFENVSDFGLATHIRFVSEGNDFVPVRLYVWRGTET